MTKRNTPWSENEIKAAIKAYFDLLIDQESHKPINKSAIYRNLSSCHPSRSAKSFEFKFQNISAILYEEKRAYADGLRPMANYQTALREAVLNHIHHTQPKILSPIEILISKLKRLQYRDYLPVLAKGTGRYGLALEQYLAIPQNSSKDADFMGIELKTKRGKSLQTLFSRVPTRYLKCKDKNQLVDKYGYFDQKRSRQALYTSFNNTRDTLGFYLNPMKGKIVVNNKKTKILEYDNLVLEKALHLKHRETAYVTVSSARLKSGKTGCRFDQLLYCTTPSIFRFLRMADDGNIYLDFTLSRKNGRVKDHGFLWRVPQEAIGDLYKKTQLIDLTIN